MEYLRIWTDEPVNGKIKLCSPTGIAIEKEIQNSNLIAELPFRGLYEGEDFIPVAFSIEDTSEFYDGLICIKFIEGDEVLKEFVDKIWKLQNLLIDENFDEVEAMLEEGEVGNAVQEWE